VPAFSDIIDFLLRLLGDDAARAEFDEDPQGTLEAAGLGGVTAQDIRDARLQLADSGAVSATDDGAGSSYPDGDDPVREIGYTTRHYVADGVDDTGPADPNPVDGGGTVTIDDRDTLFFQSISDDDVTITDSFNADNSSDSLTAIQANGSFNSDDDVTVDAANSFNTADSFNSDDDLTAVQDNDVAVDVDLRGPPTGGAAAADDPDPDPADADPPVDAQPADAEAEDPAQDPADEPADEPADDAALAG
jgi:hypothetical protein